MVREKILRPNVVCECSGLRLVVTTVALQWRRCAMTVVAEPMGNGSSVDGLTVFPRDMELSDDTGRIYKVGKAAHRVPWAGNKAWFSWSIPCPDPQARLLRLTIHALRRVSRRDGKPAVDTIPGPWSFEISLG